MKITLYLYSGLLPVSELTPINCIKCKRMLCKVRGDVLALTNSGLPYEVIRPELKYLEVLCHSCKTTYMLLFQ